MSAAQRPLCLIHTADLHDHLTPQKAERLRELKAERRALLLDCGDALQSPNLVAWPWPEKAIRLMNRAGYDAMCAGNREYGLTRRWMMGKTGEASFPVVSANLLPRGRELPQLRRWTILSSASGLRVGVFGLTEPVIEIGSPWERLSAYRFVDPLQAAGEAVAALRGQVDVLLALTHYGQRDEHKLAELHPEIDAILCGHWHRPEPSLQMCGSTALARTFHHAQGAAILTFDGATWGQESVRL
jgi:2',3'-cyclic-nucleotide 2'-phosphodiesterase (5'-nucleotidase family)